MKLFANDTELLLGRIIDIENPRFRYIFNFYLSVSGLGFYPNQSRIAINKVLLKRVN